MQILIYLNSIGKSKATDRQAVAHEGRRQKPVNSLKLYLLKSL